MFKEAREGIHLIPDFASLSMVHSGSKCSFGLNWLNVVFMLA